MLDATDISTPVTRGELRAEFEQFERRFEQKLDQKLGSRLAHLATKHELEMWVARYSHASRQGSAAWTCSNSA